MRPDPRLVLLAGVLLLAACSKSPVVKAPKIKGSEQIAPEYSYSDSEATKKRVQVRETLGLAAQRFASGDLAEAEKQAHKVLKQDPTAADAYTLLGAVAARRGQAAQAGEHYRRAAELAPRQGEVLNNYGAWLCSNGYPAEALVWFDRALAAPNYRSPGSALANSGGCALKSGQGERAERDLRRALELEPKNAYALASMAEYQYGQGRYFEARAFSERRLAAAPADASVLQLAARIEDRLGDKAAASRYQQRLRTEFPQAVLSSTGEGSQ
ncbi:type IV pilus biogenesis/stability protein PilW [Pseudoxanthomonas daejeonensis]|uniref:Type IV pilus biogenesis/stability protein PilW n=1 Tax=Pseudoxanthomonas daejeonensis TaxID=266062 RepID=A0ABQ6Z4V4_9GAMM|nr:type IV pilus biogenesis/stability protein PilW [Pseudoxanthomonas daejeonensis]KAF1693027.1 type IV pilus biogenesis/stability protein PilW [Pseudoxanthomonas daejeonensis]UNK57422.1 type IV pilus biogenesis/stability protein PilW [Pseudoxanthomonas daejeonensis]